jgi:DNA-directed RNA polymerase specialized sigma24 family protein
LEEAMRRVRLRVAPHTWEAFRLAALDGVAVSETAQRLHMKIASVYKARANVLALLREEREKLEADQ